jgi:16S rRNA (uracil1498-N3)-methyltransferase
MRTPRVFHDGPLHTGRTLALDAGTAQHLTKVLRLRAGAPVILFNGEGGEYAALLAHVERRRAEVEVGAFDPRESESPLHITLAQGISKGERMDYAIQKAVELGVARIVPVFAERSVVRLNEERLERKLNHWRAVVVSACEQCGRNRVPAGAPAVNLRDWLAQGADDGIRLALDHRATQGFGSLEAVPAAATLLVGPEGGLSNAELDAAKEAGYLPLSMGPRILRTETAAVAALAAMQTLFGDL